MRTLAGLQYEARGDGPAMLFIHGAIIADAFAPMMDEPALEPYRRIRYRRRGYGQSVRVPENSTVEMHSADARALLVALGVSRTHVVAHSGGGPVALQIAMDAPEIVSSLTLIEPALQNADMAAAFDERVRRPLAEMNRAGDRKKAVHVWMRATGGSDWRTGIETLIPGAADRAEQDADGTFEGDLAALRLWNFDDVDASLLPRPVLYLVGEHSEDKVERVTKMFAAVAPDTERVVIPDADHNMHMIWPDRVAEEIAAFLERTIP